MVILIYAARFISMRPLALALAKRGHTVALVAGAESPDAAAALQLAVEDADGISLALAAPADEASRAHCASLLISSFAHLDAALALGDDPPDLSLLWETMPRKEQPDKLLRWEMFESEEAVESGLIALGW